MGNTFFSQFLMMTNIHSLSMVILLIGLFFIINKMSKKNSQGIFYIFKGTSLYFYFQ